MPKLLVEFYDRHLAALTLRGESAVLSFGLSIIALLMHGVGIVAFCQLIHQPLWVALVLLVGLNIIPFALAYSHRRYAIETLAPMFFLYAIIAARFIFVRVFGGDVPGYFDYNLPELRSTLFRLEPWAVVAFGYTLAIQLHSVLRFTLRWIPIILLSMIVVWSFIMFVDHRTHGVTGTDPFAYVQMGIDLAMRGTPLHRFTLFPSVVSLNIAWSPIVHTGYHIPINARGDAPTVWPIGGSFAFALAYQLIGDAGVYLVNPLTSLLLLLVTGVLAWELFSDSKFRAWIVVLSIALLATSHTMFDWATVPMVDSQAALFSTLAVVMSLQGAKRRSNLPSYFLSGLFLGIAYFIRHTQVLMMPAILVLLWFKDAPKSAKLRGIFIMGMGALFVAVFDLWYHLQTFGGWFNVESTELSLFSLDTVLTTMQRTSLELFAAYELGWLLPFLFYGAYRFARDKRIEFIALALWFLILVGFHLFYPALRLRDLLPEFVPLVIVAGYGAVVFIEIVWGNSRRLVAAVGLAVTLWLWLIRVWNVVPLMWSEPQISFGYVTAEQRVSFSEIAKQIPPRAVVGSSLNTGAIELYAQRETFHPGMWSAQEQIEFIAAMSREGREIYLLEDGDVMREARNALSSHYKIEPITIINAPYFGNVGAMSGTLWKVNP